MPSLDRIITIQDPVVTRDGFGGETVNYANLAEVWADVDQTGVSEDFENDANRERALRNAKMRIHWRGDIDERMRVVYDGLGWDIEGIAEIGFRRYLELTCQTDTGRMVTTHPLTLVAGLSADTTVTADELTLTHTGGRIEFAAFTDMHIVLWRRADEPDIASVVLPTDPTMVNQIGAFNKQAMTVTRDSVAGNVWVSNQLLTFAEADVLEVA